MNGVSLRVLLALSSACTLACASQELEREPPCEQTPVLVTRWNHEASACMRSGLLHDEGGTSDCRVFAGRALMAPGGCDCDGPGRAPVDRGACGLFLSDPELRESYCVCELTQLKGAELDACRQQVTPPDLAGWCFLDGSDCAPKPAVASELLADCTSPYRFRFLGHGEVLADESLFLACYTSTACGPDGHPNP